MTPYFYAQTSRRVNLRLLFNHQIRESVFFLLSSFVLLSEAERRPLPGHSYKNNADSSLFVCAGD